MFSFLTPSNSQKLTALILFQIGSGIRYAFYWMLLQAHVYASAHKKCIDTTDIHQRSQTSYVHVYRPICNSLVSKGAQSGSLQVFADHARKNKPKTNACTIFTHHLSSRSDCSWCSDIRTWQTRLFRLWEKLEDTKSELHVWIKMAQVLGSLVKICDWHALTKPQITLMSLSA